MDWELLFCSSGTGSRTVRRSIPISLGVPGVKLGLANLVTVVGLYTVGIGGTVAVSMIRIVLVAFTFGNVFSMMYSLGGWALSILLMINYFLPTAAQLLAIMRLPEAALLWGIALLQKLMVLPWVTGLM